MENEILKEITKDLKWNERIVVKIYRRTIIKICHKTRIDITNKILFV